MRIRCFIVLVLAAAMGPLHGLVLPAPVLGQSAKDRGPSFRADVLPVFQVHCAACHAPGGEGTASSGLDLTTYQGVMKGTKFGPMVIAGDPDSSNLMRLLDWRASAQLRMPHDKKQLPIGERDTIRVWIRQGAKDN
jgi:hypothetical protein